MSKHNILIVDDQREVRRVLKTGVETLGPDFKAIEVPSAEEALLIMTFQPIDLLVVDIRLPGISGLELIEKLKKRNPNLKVFLITGLTEPKIQKQVAEAGAQAFFTKPVNLADFLDSVERTLGVVETFLPPEPAAIEEPKAIPSLPEQLSGLRQDTGACAALLFNERGEHFAQAGELPAAYQQTTFVMDIIHALNTAARVSLCLGSTRPNFHLFFSGKDHRIFAAPLGRSYALCMFFEHTQQNSKSEYPIDLLDQAILNLEAALEETALAHAVESPLPEPLPPQEEETHPEEEVEADADVDALFDMLTSAKLKPQEVNQFWNTALEQVDPLDSDDPSALSFDQAQKLGLAPDEEET
jgi:CheY-like chemotaxis protein